MSEITKLKPMTLAEYSEIVAFVQKYFPFGWVDDEDRFKNSKGESVIRMIKYITNSYDSREGGEIWQITFNHQICFSDKVNFKTDYKSLFDLTMAWLKEDWVPTKAEAKQIVIEK